MCSVIAQGMERKAAGIPPRSERDTWLSCVPVVSASGFL